MFFIAALRPYNTKFSKAFSTVWSAYETLASDENEKNALIELVKKQLSEYGAVLGEHDAVIRQLLLNHKPPQPQFEPVRTQPPPLPPNLRKPEPKIVNGMIYLGGYDWRVLEKRNGQALLLCDRIIEKRSYHSKEGRITWEDCALRKYLNSEFYNKSFSEDEKLRIVETTATNLNNPWFGTTSMTADLLCMAMVSIPLD